MQKIIVQQEREIGGNILSSTKRYMKFVKPYTLQIIGTLIIGLIKFAIPLLIPVIIKYVIDGIVTKQDLSVDEKNV